MSLQTLKSLLSEARSELTSLVRQAEREPTLSEKAVSAITYTHKRLAEKIEEALVRAGKPVAWLTPEPGAWRARYGNYELNVYRDGGMYYWQVACTERGAAETLEEAKENVLRLIGLQ